MTNELKGNHMRKFTAFIFLLFFSSTLIPIQANADANWTVSFVMMNPTTKSNVGAGTEVRISPINGGPGQSLRTNSNGIVTFTMPPMKYQLDWNLPGGATEYLLQPQTDGSIEVLSMADQKVAKNSSGNWILTSETRVPPLSNSPWQLMKHQPSFVGHGTDAHLMFLLTNGKVLVQTGSNQPSPAQWWLLTPDKQGNYYDGTWKQAPSPANYNPTTFQGVVLHNGNVMVFGGEQNYSDAGVVTQDSNICEIYNVQTNSWKQIDPPDHGQGDWAGINAPPAAELADGRVLIGFSGGANNGNNESMIYDPVANSWTLTGTNKVGENGEAGFTLLQNNKLLTVDDQFKIDGNHPASSFAEIYDPATGLWSSAGDTPLPVKDSEIGPALGLRNGNVLQTGATGNNALYNPTTNSWSAVPSWPKMNNGIQLVAQDNEAAILPNGNILTITGIFVHDTKRFHAMAPARYVEYDWKSNSWIWKPEDLLKLPSATGSNETFFLPLPNGQIMVGESGGIEFFTGTGSPDPSWLPIVASVSSQTLTTNKNYTISGQQLSGLTQGQQWGDEWEAATNYPLVRIVNNATHHVSYATVFDISSTSIAPNAPSTLSFTLASNIEKGPSKLYVVATGLASTGMPVVVN